MDLLEIFLQGLAKQGFEKSEIRILGAESILKKEINEKSINEFSKKRKLNSGSVYAMMSGKRAIPISLLNNYPDNFLCILKNCSIPIRIPRDLTKDLAYLVGLLRDGTVNEEKNGEYACAFYSKNKEFLELIKPKIENLFLLETKIMRFGECYGIRIRSKTLYHFFRIAFEFKSKQVRWNTPAIIKNSSNEIKREYISGFFDAEGGIPHLEKMEKPKRKNMYIKFVQKNKDSLEFIKNHLALIGIDTGEVYWSDTKNNLKIKMSSLKSFIEYIHSLHPEKANRLDMLNRLLVHYR